MAITLAGGILHISGEISFIPMISGGGDGEGRKEP